MTHEAYDGWQVIRTLGGGGQGTVHLATEPGAAKQRKDFARGLHEWMRNQVPGIVPNEARQDVNTINAWMLEALPEIVRTLASGEDPRALGAVKVFNLPTEEREREKVYARFTNEVRALHEIEHPAILRLLHENTAAGFMVTEYYPNGTLDQQRALFTGAVCRTLQAFLPLVEAVAALHRGGLVHRDVKPTNIFVGSDGRLILGDFGIVFFRDEAGDRLTETYERAGSRDWMAPWAHTGRRLEAVESSFDVFSLGKVLWWMLSGEPVLPFWYHRRDIYDLERRFPRDPDMAIVNNILDSCVVENESACFGSAEELRGAVYEALRVVQRHGVLLRVGVPRPCRVCVRGHYEPCATNESEDRLLPLALWSRTKNTYAPADLWEAKMTVRLFRCNECGHLEFFDFPYGNRPQGWFDNN